MDYFAAMRAFVRAVELGSFSKAAAEQEVKVSTISRHVSALELDLGAALLNRSTRALHLTEAGTAFYERASAILAEVEEARTATSALNSRPQGLLRLALPGAFARRHIAPHLKDFRALYPDIRLDCCLSEETVDLIETGADLAIRIGALVDSSLVARKLAPHRRLAVASPDYLAAHGPLDEPADLAGHDCLLFALQAKDAWFVRPRGEDQAEPAEIRVRGGFRANDSDVLLQAARDGLGIGLLPTWLLAEEVSAGRLVPVLTSWRWAIAPGPARAIWGVYPPKKTVSPKVRAFLDFIAARFGKPPYWEAGLEA